MAIRVSNYTVQISTVVATFEMSRPIQDCPDMINWVAEQIAQTNLGNVTIYLNGECKAHYDFFEEGHVPAVWTHTPLPVGMDARALQSKFEERAASVLGDYEYTPPFTVYSPDGTGMFKDNRYACPSLRAAWMMYVDQAIEHFVASKE